MQTTQGSTHQVIRDLCPTTGIECMRDDIERDVRENFIQGDR